jgi:hypothetical protein
MALVREPTDRRPLVDEVSANKSEIMIRMYGK